MVGAYGVQNDMEKRLSFSFHHEQSLTSLNKVDISGFKILKINIEREDMALGILDFLDFLLNNE